MVLSGESTLEATSVPCQARLTPRVYWSMVRDLLDEALSFAVTLRSAPYEALDERGRELLLDAAAQLVDSAGCVLDAVEYNLGPSLSSLGNVRPHPCMRRLRFVAAEARIRLEGRRAEIEAASAPAPIWRLADAVCDARAETVRGLEAIAACYGAPRETRRRFRTYWDEHAHYAALASRATRRLHHAMADLASVTPMATRLAELESRLARHTDSFEFGLLRQSNRWKLHALLERLRDMQCGGMDELAQRRLWNESWAVVLRIAEDQSARAS
jgi:hypothetical protein